MHFLFFKGSVFIIRVYIRCKKYVKTTDMILTLTFKYFVQMIDQFAKIRHFRSGGRRH